MASITPSGKTPEQEQEPNPEPGRFAYATLITRASYLAGVIILARTLRQHNSQYPLIVLYTPDLAPHALRALQLEASRSNTNIILQPCAYLLPPGDLKPQLIAERFEDTWTKLRVFELHDVPGLGHKLNAVCYLDADMAIFQNLDIIFTQPAAAAELPPGGLAANHSCVCNRDGDPWAPSDWRRENCAYTPVSHPEALITPTQPLPGGPATHHQLNGGMFVFHPSAQLWEDMMAFFSSSAPLLATFKFPDQDFLARFFRERWRALGWRFNALKTMRYWHENLWRDDEVVCLHYIVDKPWTRRVGADGVAGYKGRDGVTHRWWWEAYEVWERERSADGEGGREIVRLVRMGVAAPLDAPDGWGEGGLDPGLAAIGGAVQAFANNSVTDETDIPAKAINPQART
ncbi:Uu.00g070570.m01.CDS01 [Anthostomella pinea]|uniref:Uu.00g070570.m01.CDS01 n=1 Tax=Anthostomella pinea TaxID=933095 RepID=A0AAI8YL98_9PEZI|nr:Uu.00g070570.m01.CDS01 [Anthostomella pinea]